MTIVEDYPELYVDPLEVLNGAPAQNFTSVVIVGQSSAGLLYIASSNSLALSAGLLRKAMKQMGAGGEFDEGFPDGDDEEADDAE